MRHSIVIVIFLILSICATAQNKIYLVAVGISDYPGVQNDLRLSAHDAQTIQWVYQKNKKAETVLLINDQAKLNDVCNQMNNMYQKAGKEDIIVFFFSGHGSKGSFVCYDGFLTYDKIRTSMAKSKAKYKMIFADACLSGQMRQQGKYNINTADSNLSSMEVMLFLSSRSNEFSIERKNMKNGFFTAYLQRGLRGGADIDRDKVITAKELYTFVRDGVIKLSDDKQHPVMWGKFEDTMPIISW
jgi:uncharacterized caspase-like protein